ncbi:MAG: hypothetical protein ACKO96_15095, partial [Flammeovirgaceae bacterium]
PKTPKPQSGCIRLIKMFKSKSTQLGVIISDEAHHYYHDQFHQNFLSSADSQLKGLHKANPKSFHSTQLLKARLSNQK